MNEYLILSMAEPYVKDGSITYDQFENIYSMLSLEEMYDATDILYKNGIDLIEEDERTDKNRNVKQSNDILCKLIQQGNLQATQDLCVKYQCLVDRCAATYLKEYEHHLDFEDLEQVGFMGLIKAAKKYNEHGFLFSTYAGLLIQQAISREIMNNGFAIRIPIYMMERINKIAAIENKFLDCIPEERIKRIADKMGMTEDEVRECMVLKENILTYSSLNTPVGEEEDSELVDFLSSEDVLSVEDIVISREMRRRLDELLDLLNDSERQVLRMHFGLDDGNPRTLEYVRQKFGVTREEIREIKARAIKKMKLPSRLKN